MTASAQLLAESEAARRAGRIPDAIALAERAVAAAGESPVPGALARLELGNLLRYVPETVRALQLLADAERTLRRESHPKLPRALTIQGMALGDAGDYRGALSLYREALAMLEARGDDRDVLQEAACVGAVGLACTQLSDFAQAEAAYRRSIALYSEGGQRESAAYLYNNLAILRVRAIQALADPSSPEALRLGDEMAAFVRDGLAVNAETAANPHVRALLLNTHGDGLRALGRVREALPILQEALETYRAMGNPRGEVDAATDLAAALLQAGDVGQALVLLQRARSQVDGLDLKDHERRLEELLADAYERGGDATSALAHYKAFHRLHREAQDQQAQRELQRITLRAEIDKAMRESREDALTGIPNRRRFEEMAGDQPEVLPERFALAVFDIDHFKQVNDTFSHAVGDRVLREVGRMLKAHCREGDFVARIGGEEFVLVLPAAGAGEARASCERLREVVERHDWPSVAAGLAVTISVGVACADGKSSLQDLMQAADARLYDAKRSGRNVVAA